MVNWYVVAECEWLGPNFGQSEYIDMNGYTEGTMGSQNIQTNGEVGDPFLSYGIDTETWAFGQAQMEIGLIGSRRIRINSSGIYGWDGDSWENLIGGVGGGKDNLYELDDVVITGTPADNEVLAYDSGSSKWINQTAGEAGLSLSGHTHGQLHDQNHDNTDHTTNYEAEFSKNTGFNKDFGTITGTVAQGDDSRFHTIYSLESHNNTYHSTNYEPAFSKNTAFNKNFGTLGTEVCVGDDSRLSDARTPTAHVLATSGPHSSSLPLADIADYSAGRIIYGGVSDWQFLTLGTENYVLKAGATYPAWGQVDWGELAGTQPPPVSHNNTYHSTNYHTEAAGTGVATVHSDITSTGSQSIITTDERNALHTIYQDSAAVAAVNAAGLSLASTKVIDSADEDLTFTFGRASLGSPATDIMYLAHRDMLTTSNYALRQTSAGITSINSPTGGYIAFRINNAIKMQMDASALTMSVPIAMGGNDISSSGSLAFKVSGDNDDYIQMSASGNVPYFGSIGASFVITSAANLYFRTINSIHLQPNGDNGNYVEISTTANIPKIDFVGGNGLITNVADPTDNQDVATKAYTDLLKEKGATFPVSPVEGDLHYDTVDEALYRRSGDAQAWIQIGGAGVGSNTALTLEQARTNSNQIAGTIDMNQNLIIDLPPPTADTDVSNRKHARHGIASDDLIFSNDTERTSSNPPMTKVKEITVYRSAKLRVYWEHKCNVGGVTISDTRVYVNGVAVGSLHENLTTSYVAFTEDIEVNNGDTIEIWGMAFTDVPVTVYIRYQRLKFIEYVSTGGY